MTETFPLIIKIAAWVYVLKQFSIVLVPIFGFGVIPGVCYGVARVTGMSHEDAAKMISNAMKEGVKDALEDL